MIVVDEVERKYIITDFEKSERWEKEQIVYQWYTCIEDTFHKKLKLIFDLCENRLIYVEVCKKNTGIGSASKTVNYLDISSFQCNRMIGVPFVLKRRSIKRELFVDRFVRSSGICKYLLEDEGNDLEIRSHSEFRIIKEVTDTSEYYNQNMTTLFSESDAEQLSFLLSLF